MEELDGAGLLQLLSGAADAAAAAAGIVKSQACNANSVQQKVREGLYMHLTTLLYWENASTI